MKTSLLFPSKRTLVIIVLPYPIKYLATGVFDHPSDALHFPFTIGTRVIVSHGRANFLPTVLLVEFESTFHCSDRCDEVSIAVSLTLSNAALVPAAIRLPSSDDSKAMFLAGGKATTVSPSLIWSCEFAVSMPLTVFPAAFVFISSWVGLNAEAVLSTVYPGAFVFDAGGPCICSWTLWTIVSVGPPALVGV